MQSAIIYLTLGAMLMRIAERRLTKIYCCTVADGPDVLVGLSRVYLGVHYPTDVLAGWIVGLFWASICWLVAQHYEVRAGIKRGKAQEVRAERRRVCHARGRTACRAARRFCTRCDRRSQCSICRASAVTLWDGKTR